MRPWALVFQIGLIVSAVLVFGCYIGSFLYTTYHENELNQEEDD